MEVTISLISHLSSMHNIPLKAGFDTYMLRTLFKEIGGRHKNRDDYQN
jgi:hypothetical protein